jgi:hypothetical protein
VWSLHPWKGDRLVVVGATSKNPVLW